MSRVDCVIYRNTLYYVTCEYVILLFLFQSNLVIVNLYVLVLFQGMKMIIITCETDCYSSVIV